MNPLEDKNLYRLARKAYEEYGHKVPWEMLTKEKKRRWKEAASAIVSDFMD